MPSEEPLLASEFALSASDCILLAGPTAVGKSEVALLLAQKVGGEIISVDSMQVYRGLDIGTAKPTGEERARVAHHLIDILELSESFDAGRFIRLARQALAEIRRRKKTAILCGGTGLYFRAILEGLGETPPGDPALRAELESTPLDQLLAELAERDPETFQRVDRQNPRRVVRAVEVCRLTGQPFSKQRAIWRNESEGNSIPFFGLIRPGDELRRRIDERVDSMFARGLVAETERLLKQGLEENRTARQALGYRQVIEYLRGEKSMPEAIETAKIRTRQFARRQRTWFRHQAGISWLSCGQPAEALATEIAEKSLFFHGKGANLDREEGKRAANAQD